jgi:hypothetical protein
LAPIATLRARAREGNIRTVSDFAAESSGSKEVQSISAKYLGLPSFRV